MATRAERVEVSLADGVRGMSDYLDVNDQSAGRMSPLNGRASADAGASWTPSGWRCPWSEA